MSGIVAFIRQCLAVGMDHEMALLAAAQFESNVNDTVAAALAEAAEQEASRRAKNAERVRKSRERNVTSRNIEAHPGTSRTEPFPQCEELALTSNTENNLTPIPPSYSPPALSDFGRFWEAYPSKVGKRAAEAAYDRALKRSDPTAILEGLHRAQLSRRWQEGFIPNPTTWLNQDRWLDEPDETARAPPMSAGLLAAAARAEGRRRLMARFEGEEDEANQSVDSSGSRGVVLALSDARHGAGRA